MKIEGLHEQCRRTHSAHCALTSGNVLLLNITNIRGLAVIYVLGLCKPGTREAMYHPNKPKTHFIFSHREYIKLRKVHKFKCTSQRIPLLHRLGQVLL